MGIRRNIDTVLSVIGVSLTAIEITEIIYFIKIIQVDKLPMSKKFIYDTKNKKNYFYLN